MTCNKPKDTEAFIHKIMYVLKCHKKSNPSSCTLESLNRILTHIKPGYSSHKNYFLDEVCSDDLNEVFPNIYIGNYLGAKKKDQLCRLGVTHVLNCAGPSVENYVGCVRTSQTFYDDVGIKYLGLPIDDIYDFDITAYFDKATRFVDSALQSKGKVLVNCMMGMSRSATIVIAYLMMRQGMSVQEALTTVRKKREVHPNLGFLRQLIDLDTNLKKKVARRNTIATVNPHND